MQIRVDQAHTRADLAYTSRSVAHTRSTSLSAVHTCGLRTKRLAGGGAAAGAGTAPERWSGAAALCGGTGARGGGTEGGAEVRAPARTEGGEAGRRAAPLGRYRASARRLVGAAARRWCLPDWVGA